MPTLVLSPRYSPDSIAMWHAAAESGWEVQRLPTWRSASTLAGRDATIYGEPLFAVVAAEALEVSLLGAPPHWLPALPEQYRRREVRLLTLGEAGGVRSRAFFKPADDKCFPARVYESGWELPLPGALSEFTPVLMAEPVRWEVEFRCFVLAREVVTLSPYARNGNLAQAQDESWPATESEKAEVLDFAGEVLHAPEVLLPPALVVDVGRIAGRGWAVVEANPAWSSGLYGCDPCEVLRVIQRACVRTSQIDEQDRRWLIGPEPDLG